MAHDVFISYSDNDKSVAEAVCAVLESKHIRCWIAPRDIQVSAVWAEAVVDAIDESRFFVLVFSSSSNSSRQVVREVERAVSCGVAILPLRIDDAPLSKAMQFYIDRYHWLDARTKPLKKHLQQLAQTIQGILAEEYPVSETIEAPEAEERTRKEAEKATKEKARQEAERAEETRKAREAEERAKREAEERARKEAEKVAKEKARQEEAIARSKLETEKRPAGAGKKKTKFRWLWAGVALLLVGLGIFAIHLLTSEQPQPAPEVAPPSEEITPLPAAFQISPLSISPTEIGTGETVNISILVANTGGQSGSYKLTLKINGVMEAEREVTIDSGASEQVSFTTSKADAGTYSVDVNGVTGTFEVKTKPVFWQEARNHIGETVTVCGPIVEQSSVGHDPIRLFMGAEQLQPQAVIIELSKDLRGQFFTNYGSIHLWYEYPKTICVTGLIMTNPLGGASIAVTDLSQIVIQEE